MYTFDVYLHIGQVPDVEPADVMVLPVVCKEQDVPLVVASPMHDSHRKERALESHSEGVVGQQVHQIYRTSHRKDLVRVQFGPRRLW